MTERGFWWHVRQLPLWRRWHEVVPLVITLVVLGCTLSGLTVLGGYLATFVIGMVVANCCAFLAGYCHGPCAQEDERGRNGGMG